MNQIIKAGALVCALAMLEWNAAAVAEEKRLGDYIYVPAMSAPGSVGTISLRVEGVTDGGTVESLAGAEFGVYVYASDGKLTPWANPLLPSEPMRIRTGETETRFSLPQGTEFYLRQESAPEGYIFDAQTLIPVTDSEIVVRNQAYGRVTISVRDTLGEGIEGVSLTATDGAGNQTELVTDENGQAVLLCDHAGAYAIAESGLPEGVLPAENDSVQVQAAPASAAEVAFEHPAPGLVQAAATLVSVNALGEQEEKPLAGLALCVAGQTATTDADILIRSQPVSRISRIPSVLHIFSSYSVQTLLGVIHLDPVCIPCLHPFSLYTKKQPTFACCPLYFSVYFFFNSFICFRCSLFPQLFC